MKKKNTFNSQAAYLANTCRLPLGTLLAKFGLTRMRHTALFPPGRLDLQITPPRGQKSQNGLKYYKFKAFH